MGKNIQKFISNPERVFIIIAGIFGLMTIFATPIFTGADEESHFIRAWGISNGELFLSSKDGNEVNMPKAFRKTIGCLQSKIAQQGNAYEYKYVNYGKELSKTTNCALSIPVDEHDSERVLASSASYNPLVYLPQVLMIYLGKIFNLPIFVIGYMVRLSVLIVYISLIYVAIRLLIHRQWVLVGVALLPHVMMQMTNPGADHIIFGVGAIFVATIIRSRQLSQSKYESERNRLLSLLLVSTIFLMIPKGVFPGICFLPFIIFFGGKVKREVLPKIGIALGGVIAGLIWQKISSATLPLTPGPSLSSLALSFPKSFIKTMFYEWANRDFLYKGIGLGLLNKVGLPGIAISLMNMLVAFYIFVSTDKKESEQQGDKNLSRTAWIVSLAIIVGSFAAMHVMAYVLQSGDGIINGVQPRYFYPALFILAMIPMRRYIYVANEAIYRNIVIFGSVFVLTANTLAIIVKYYM